MDPGAYVCQPGPSASAPVQEEVDDTTTTGPSKTLQHLCTKYQITAFQRPFYLLMIMKLLPDQWGDHAELLLRTAWSTAWGGGKVVNALLFNGERIVPESAVDMRRGARDQCFDQGLQTE